MTQHVTDEDTLLPVVMNVPGDESSIGELGAQVLEQHTGEIDKLGRIGDQQFALIMPEKNKQQSEDLAAAINKEIAQRVLSGENSPTETALTVNFGISSNPLDGATAAELIAQAQNYIEKEQNHG